ncbi:hypothetical protein V6N13_109229 [Hibiscus sabdariffa]
MQLDNSWRKDCRSLATGVSSTQEVAVRLTSVCFLLFCHFRLSLCDEEGEPVQTLLHMRCMIRFWASMKPRLSGCRFSGDRRSRSSLAR